MLLNYFEQFPLPFSASSTNCIFEDNYELNCGKPNLSFGINNDTIFTIIEDCNDLFATLIIRSVCGRFVWKIRAVPDIEPDLNIDSNYFN